MEKVPSLRPAVDASGMSTSCGRHRGGTTKPSAHDTLPLAFPLSLPHSPHREPQHQEKCNLPAPHCYLLLTLGSLGPRDLSDRHRLWGGEKQAGTPLTRATPQLYLQPVKPRTRPAPGWF